MTAPNMATITSSLERSMQNFSLNHHTNGREEHTSGGDNDNDSVGNNFRGGGNIERSSTSDDAPENHHPTNTDTILELNSQISLPYHWEQCLDLKTGEIYYINWSNGMKAKEDPRIISEYNEDLYSEEDDCSYDSEDESSFESSPTPSSSSRDQNHHHQPQQQQQQQQQQQHYRPMVEKEDHVLVVAGCKSCFMYFMVPKQVEDCPKCSGQLLHFDRSENSSL